MCVSQSETAPCCNQPPVVIHETATFGTSNNKFRSRRSFFRQFLTKHQPCHTWINKTTKRRWWTEHFPGIKLGDFLQRKSYLSPPVLPDPTTPLFAPWICRFNPCFFKSKNWVDRRRRPSVTPESSTVLQQRGDQTTGANPSPYRLPHTPSC